MVLFCDFIINQMQDKILLEKEQSKRRYRSKIRIGLIVANIALGFFYFGYCLVYFGSIPITTILKAYHAAIDQGVAQGILNGCIPVGGFLGSMASSYIIARLSRRKCLLLIDLAAAVTGALLYIPNFYSLIVFRVAQGFCVGVFSTISALTVKELAPVEIAGTLGAFLETNLCVGNFVAYFITYCLKKITGDLTCQSFWPVVFAVPFLILVIQAIILVWVFPFQTPKYYLLKGEEEEAKKLIEMIYLDEFVEQVLQEKKRDIEPESRMSVAKNEESLLQEEQSETNPFRKSMLRAGTIVGVHLAIMQQFSGINAINIYCNPIVTRTTRGELVLLMSSLINLEKIITVLISSVLLAHFGRKPLLQFGALVAGIACIMSAIGFFLQQDYFSTSEKLIIVGLFIFMGNFGLSLGPVVWLYVPEIVGPQMVPFTTAANWISASLIVILFPIVNDHVLGSNPGALFLFFAVWCFGSLLFNDRFVVETKNKTERQIREEYSLSPLN